MVGERGAVAADCTIEELQTLLNGLKKLAQMRRR
jgi:hypothetical protein